MEEADAMYKSFREKGYSHKPLKKAKSKALRCKRECILETQTVPPEKLETCPRIIMKFGSQWTQIKSILEENWHILKSTPLIADTVGPRAKKGTKPK